MTLKPKTKAAVKPKRKHDPAQPVFIATTKGDVIAWDALSSKYATKDGKGGEKSQALVDPFAQQYTQWGLVEPPYDLDLLMSLIQVNTWHSRCCEVIAQDVAGLGFGFQAAPGYDEPAEAELKEVQTFFNDPSIFNRPVAQVLTDCQKDFQAIGCLALEVVRENYDPKGKPALLAHLPANTIRPHKQGNKYCQKRGTLTRWFKRFGYDKDVDKMTGLEAPTGTLEPDKRASEIIWDVNYNGRSDFYGMAPIVPAIGAIEGCLAVRDYNIDFFRNHGVPAYAVYITGDYNLGRMVRVKLEDDGSGTIGEVYDPGNPNMTPEYFQYKIISQVQKHLTKLSENPHAPLILAVPGASAESRVELKFEPLSVEIKESSFRLYKKDNRDEIIAAHGIPSYRIGLTETGSLGGSTAVESNRIYRDSVIKPRKDRLGNIVNQVIWQGFQFPSVEFYFNPLDLAEEDHEKDIIGFLLDNGAMTPNEARVSLGVKFGLQKIEDAPGMDSFYFKGNVIYSPTPSKQSTAALNGAQVSSLILVLDAIAKQTLTADAGALIISQAFLIPLETAKAMVGNPAPPTPTPENFVEAVKGFQADLERIVINDNGPADK